jgi:spore maturation protein CgeB
MKRIYHIALIGPAGYSNKGIMDGFMQSGWTDYRCFDFQLERFSIGKDLMQKKMIYEAEQMKPDLIFCQIQGSDIIDLETWQALQRIAFTVNFNFDVRINEQTQWLYNLVPHIGLVCFSNQEDVDECNRRGYKNVMLLQSSADPDVYKPKEGIERKGVVFIGTNFLNTNHQFPLSKERVEMVEFLKKEFPNDFKVYGNNWGDSHITVFKDDKNEEVEIYQSAAIVINQNNFNHTLYTSDRLWRAVFCGAFCITEYFKGVEKLFDPYNQVECWKNFDDLARLIEHYLSHPESAIRNALSARQHALANHTWSSRVKEMMAFIENLQPNITDERNACIKAGGHVINGVIPGLGGDEDAKYKDVPCDCGKLRGDWYQCECGNKQYQFRWVENI